MKRFVLRFALLAVICSALGACAIVPLRPAYVGGGGYDHHWHDHDRY